MNTALLHWKEHGIALIFSEKERSVLSFPDLLRMSEEIVIWASNFNPEITVAENCNINVD